jgi:hypothetical protein
MILKFKVDAETKDGLIYSASSIISDFIGYRLDRRLIERALVVEPSFSAIPIGWVGHVEIELP